MTWTHCPTPERPCARGYGRYGIHPLPPETFDTVIAQEATPDSNAAIAGALAGLRYGYDALPAEKEKLLRFDYLNDLAERVAEYSERQGR